MSNFIVNFKKLVKDITFHLRRHKVSDGENNLFIDYMQAMIKGISDTYDQFVVFREQTLKDLNFTSQNISLSKILNLTFDPSLQRIFIENNTDFLPDNFVSFENEALPPIFTHFENEGADPLYTFFQDEYDNLDVDFFVHVPADQSLDLNEVRALVNKYRFAGKLFGIIEF